MYSGPKIYDGIKNGIGKIIMPCCGYNMIQQKITAATAPLAPNA
jgi:hypothetical protein